MLVKAITALGGEPCTLFEFGVSPKIPPVYLRNMQGSRNVCPWSKLSICGIARGNGRLSITAPGVTFGRRTEYAKGCGTGIEAVPN